MPRTTLNASKGHNADKPAKPTKLTTVVGAVLCELLDAVESDQVVLSVVKSTKRCKFAKREQLEDTLCIFAENQPGEGDGVTTERDLRAYLAGIERAKLRRKAQKSGAVATKKKPEGKGLLCKPSEVHDFKYQSSSEI